MGNRGVKPKPKAPATRLPAKGKPGQPRRTPQHIADPAGLCDTYDVEDIIAERMAENDKGNSEKQWLVQWKGFPASVQTWEPLENLSGCEAFIARFNEEREANERADLEKRKRTRDAQEEERQKKEKSESGTALLDSATSAPLQAQTRRQTSVVWTAFTEDGEDPGFARCVLHGGNGVCGIQIKHCSGTTNLRAHLMGHHKEWFIQETEKKCDMQDKLVANGTGAIVLQTTTKWTAQKIHLSKRKLSYWLCRRKRAPHLVSDKEFKHFCDEISCSKYQPCSEKEVLKQTLEMAAAGRVNNRRIIRQLKEQKVKPSMASDIWSDSDVSLMGTFSYYIDVVQKAKGMTTYFHRSGNRLDRLADLQKRFDMPQRKPTQTGNSVRWHYTHDSLNWFREQKVIVQNYDINYGAEARHEDGPYADSHMDYNDWKVNEHSVAVLYPAATVVNDIEGTQYVTASLVLPSVYMLIHKVRKGEIVCN